jgi:hypothetical protein
MQLKALLLLLGATLAIAKPLHVRGGGGDEGGGGEGGGDGGGDGDGFVLSSAHKPLQQ